MTFCLSPHKIDENFIISIFFLNNDFKKHNHDPFLATNAELDKEGNNLLKEYTY